MFYSFFWVISGRLNFTCQSFGTPCLFHLHRQVGMTYDDTSYLPAYKARNKLFLKSFLCESYDRQTESVYCTGVCILYWSLYTVLESVYCTGVGILYWSLYTVLESVYCTAVGILYWSVCTVLESVYCTGVGIMYWSLYTVLESIYCTGVCILYWSLYTVLESVHCTFSRYERRTSKSVDMRLFLVVIYYIESERKNGIHKRNQSNAHFFPLVI
jgi:hypothetical protein